MEKSKGAPDWYRSLMISAFIPNTKIAYNYNQDLFNVNVEFVNKIVQHFKDSRLIFASSVSVYNNAGDVIKENSALNPSSSYAVSKLWGEIIVKQVNSYSIFRISSLIGKGVKGETFVPMIINQSIQKKSITLFGSGERKQNYINYSDVAQLFISAAHLNNNSTYLAVNPYSFSNIEVAEKVKSLFPAVNINYLGKDSTESFIYDGSKTFAELNFTPSISLTDSILEIIK